MSSNIWARYSVQSLTQSTFPPKSPSPNVKVCWESLVAHPFSRLCQQRCCGAAWAHRNPGDRSSEAWQWMHQQHSPFLIQTPEASCLVARRSCKERQTPKIKSNCPVISFEYYNWSFLSQITFTSSDGTSLCPFHDAGMKVFCLPLRDSTDAG